MIQRMLSLVLALSLAACAATPAAAANVIASPATFLKTLAAAVGGDVITLEAGDYGDVYIRAGRPAYSPPLTINANAAVFRSLRFDKAKGIRFRNITFNQSSNPKLGGLNLVGGSDLQVDGLYSFGAWRYALNATEATDLRFTRINAQGGGSDGIDLSGVQRVYIEDVAIHGGVPTPGAHADGIQFYSKPGMLPLADITINRVRCMGDTQCVVRYGDQLPATRIRVNDVRATTTMIAVALDHPSGKPCIDCAITNSVAESLPGGKMIVQIAPQTLNARFTGTLSGNSPNSPRPPAR